MRDLTAALVLKHRNELSQPAARALRDVRKEVESTAAAVNSAGQIIGKNFAEQSRVAAQAISATTRANDQALDARLQKQRQFNAAYATLGMRSEQEIQAEIRRTQWAYERLAQSGKISGNEQQRALEQTKRRVAELRRELQATDSQVNNGALGRAARGASAAWRIGGAVAGAAAGAMVVAPAVRETMSYDRRLAMMANTAFADRDTGGRRRGMKELDQTIRGAVSYGGGSPEQAADTLDNMLASGAISDKSAMNLLPTLQKFATATGANPNELGNIAIRAMQNFGIKEKDIPMALDMALKAGQAGGFELKDMAKWLPQQMAMAKTLGMTGLGSFGKLLAANQASVITAGTKDEAGNNIVNLLEKINSQDTQHKAKKLGIDLTGSLTASRAKGTDPLDAFVGIVERVMNKDKRYQDTQKRLAGATGDERKEILQSQATLLEGTAIGQLIHDRQALMGLVAYMGNKDYLKDVQKQIGNAAGTGDANYALIAGTASFKIDQLKNKETFAKVDALGGFDTALGNVAEKLTDYADRYPGVAAALSGMETAVRGASTALMAFAGVQFMRGAMGAGAAGAAGAAGSTGLAAMASGALGGVNKVARFFNRGGSAALSLLFSGVEAAGVASNDSLSANQKKSEYSRVAGGAVGGLAGMVAGAGVGAAAGTVVPGVGNVVGALAGAALGYFGHNLGETLGKSLGDAMFNAESQKQAQQPPPQPIQLNNQIMLDGRLVYQSVAEIMAEEARRH